MTRAFYWIFEVKTQAFCLYINFFIYTIFPINCYAILNCKMLPLIFEMPCFATFRVGH